MEKHVHSIDNEKVKDIDILQVDTIYEMATLFKMFADPTRLKIMNVLLNNELNVCEIAYLLNMTHSAISHQLATLKLSNLVKSNKKGIVASPPPTANKPILKNSKNNVQ